MPPFLFLVLCMIVPDPTYGSCLKGEDSTDWSRILPESISGWQKQEDRGFNRNNLYSYIDGGAELYLSYGFRTVLSRIYLCKDQPDLILEIFDMGSSANAFGVFAHTRETVDSTFGQGSQYTEGLLLFWKNNYYISILASPETPESKQAIFSLAHEIESTIPEKGKLPRLIQCLPRTGIIEESIRYFHHYIWLNTHYYIADTNILHIDPTTEAMLARYHQAGSRSLILLVIKYAGSQQAETACRDFIAAYLPGLGQKSSLKIEDRSWIGYRLFHDLLIVGFNGESQKIIEDIIKETVSNYQNL